MLALVPCVRSTPDGRDLTLRFEPVGSTWHASVEDGPEAAGLDLREAVALATGEPADGEWIVELERELDPEYALARLRPRRRRAYAAR